MSLACYFKKHIQEVKDIYKFVEVFKSTEKNGMKSKRNWGNGDWFQGIALQQSKPKKVYSSTKNLFFFSRFWISHKVWLFGHQEKLFFLPEVKLLATYWIGKYCDQKSKIWRKYYLSLQFII